MVRKQQHTEIPASRPQNTSFQRMRSSRQSQHLTAQEAARRIDQRSGKRVVEEVFRFGSQNVRTLNHRRSAIIAQSLEGAKCDIVALQETRQPGVGVIQEGNITIYYSGHETGSAQQGKSGVGLALSERANNLLLGKPDAISPRIMVAHFKNKVTFISAYAPTHSSVEQRTAQKAQFFEELQSVIDGAPKKNMLVIAGDFNARIGSSTNEYIDAGIIGRHGVGVRNSSGDQLLNFCLKNKLCVANSFFDHPDHHKFTWQHPRSRKWHVIDYILVQRTYLRKVRNTRVYPGIDCWSDHKFVGSDMNVPIPMRKRYRGPQKGKKTAC